MEAFPNLEILTIPSFAEPIFQNRGDSGPSFELAVDHFMNDNLAPTAGFGKTTFLGASSRNRVKKKLCTSWGPPSHCRPFSQVVLGSQRVARKRKPTTLENTVAEVTVLVQRSFSAVTDIVQQGTFDNAFGGRLVARQKSKIASLGSAR